VPQLLYKGGILNTWGKKMAVAIDSGFHATLPRLPEVSPAKADIAWLVYDLVLDQGINRFNLILSKTVYAQFKPVLDKITIAEPGPITDFIEHLQDKLDEKLENNPPDAPPLDATTLT
jgi:hypothetical protein